MSKQHLSILRGRTVEIIDMHLDFALNDVAVRVGDGARGWVEEHSPFDAIVLTAAASETPAELLNQLKGIGRMVIPLGSGDVQQLSVV